MLMMGLDKAFPEAVWLETGHGCHSRVYLCVRVCVSVCLGDQTISIVYGCLSGEPGLRVPLCNLAWCLSVC